jgi:hypothetical protein
MSFLLPHHGVGQTFACLKPYQNTISVHCNRDFGRAMADGRIYRGLAGAEYRHIREQRSLFAAKYADFVDVSIVKASFFGETPNIVQEFGFLTSHFKRNRYGFC